MRDGVNTCEATLFLEVEHADKRALFHEGQAQYRRARCLAMYSSAGNGLWAKASSRITVSRVRAHNEPADSGSSP